MILRREYSSEAAITVMRKAQEETIKSDTFTIQNY
jgi:hypothetical protein